MSKSSRTISFVLLILVTLACSCWLLYKAVWLRSNSLALHSPVSSVAVDASIVDRRVEDDEYDIKYQFTPQAPGALPIKSLFVEVPKELFDALPEENATIPVVYLKSDPQWHSLALNLKSESAQSDIRTVFLILLILGLLVFSLGIAWSYWLCFASDQPLSVQCSLGCLNDSHHDFSKGANTVVMQYQTFPIGYDLDTTTHVHEVTCRFCRKGVKLQVLSRKDARLLATQYFSAGAAGGLLGAMFLQMFWTECPLWITFGLAFVSVAGGVVACLNTWSKPAYFRVITIAEGKGKVVHSKTSDNGTLLNWYEHEVLK